MLMHCKADVQTQPMYHPTCICTCDLLQVEHKLWVGMWLRKAALGSRRAPLSLTSQDETGCSAPGLHTGQAPPLSPCQPCKRSVPVHGFDIGPLTRSKYHPERSLLRRYCSQITIDCILLTRHICHWTEKGICILKL